MWEMNFDREGRLVSIVENVVEAEESEEDEEDEDGIPAAAGG